MIDLDKRIGEIVMENPAAIQVFEKLHIDYWDGGDLTFAEASRLIGLTPSELFALIAVSGCSALPEEQSLDWTREPLRALVTHILDKHHAFARSELARLSSLCETVKATHHQTHPELGPLSELLGHLRAELTPHLLNEEQIIFPFLLLMEEAIVTDRPIPAPLHTLESSVRALKSEHETIAELLRQMRSVSFDFHIPLDGSSSYRLLMSGLLGLEQQLHNQLHLENNVLFPRALAATATMVEVMP